MTGHGDNDPKTVNNESSLQLLTSLQGSSITKPIESFVNNNMNLIGT